MLTGQLGALGDLLIQRVKALETSIGDMGCSTAKHQELIPPVGASLTSDPERRKAAKAEMAAMKLKEMVAKSRPSK